MTTTTYYDPDPVNSTILIVDDEPELRQLLYSALTTAGYFCVKAGNGIDALQLITKHEIDLVISDICMPELDGMQLLQQIHTQWPQMPVILMTGYSVQYSHSDIIKAGAIDYISKPLQIAPLLATVTRSVREHSRLIQFEQELRCTRQKAQKTVEAHGLFLASMSHEIRTPMNSILGMTHLALKTKLSKKQHKYLTISRSSAESLLQIIDDILDFSKMDAGYLHLEKTPFSLTAMLENVIQSFSENMRQKGLQLTLDTSTGLPKNIVGDELRLRQILLNLLSNALKFTEQGEIRLKVTSLEHNDKEILLEFRVSDTGIGISTEAQQKIFESFTQENSSTCRTHGGTGLGLAICKQLAGLLGGEIGVRSKKGKGATFFFTAKFSPCAADSQQIEVPEDKKTGELQPLSLLLVEDNAANRELAKIVLEQRGHTVTMAQNGIEALTLLSMIRFDAVLMDLQMPEMDGLTATRLIRQCESATGPKEINHKDLLSKLHKWIKAHHTPIIAMTAQAMAGDREQCLRAGMDGYLTKPFQPKEIFRTLKQTVCYDTSTRHSSTGDETSGEKCVEKNSREHLVHTYNLPDKQITSMMRSAADNLEQKLETVELALQQQDLTTLSKTAHSIKGVLHNIGLHKWAELTGRIELNRVRSEENLWVGLNEQVATLRQSLEPIFRSRTCCDNTKSVH